MCGIRQFPYKCVPIIYTDIKAILNRVFYEPSDGIRFVKNIFVTAGLRLQAGLHKPAGTS